MAHAEDGLVEAYYDPKAKFTLGLQFHPERMLKEDAGHWRIWKAFGEIKDTAYVCTKAANAVGISQQANLTESLTELLDHSRVFAIGEQMLDFKRHDIKCPRAQGVHIDWARSKCHVFVGGVNAEPPRPRLAIGEYSNQRYSWF